MNMNRYLPLMALVLLSARATAQDDSILIKENFFVLPDFKNMPKLMAQRLVEKPFVPDTAVRCITYDFTQQFKLGPASSPRPIPIAPMEFTRASYDQAISDSQFIPDSIGVVVHFGLVNGTASKQFDVAFEFVDLEHKGNGYYDYVAPNVHYTISNGALVRNSGGIANWKSNWTTFTSDVVFMDDLNGSYRTHDTLKDVEFVVFPNTEIQQLITHNGMSGTDKFKLKPTAEPTNGTSRDFRQGIVWIPLNVTLNDTVDPSKPFKNKGADLGAPCPKDCPPKVILRTSGAAIRPNCP